MTEHCRDCGSEICNHGVCPECDRPCRHCPGGDRNNKFFGYDEEGFPITNRADLEFEKAKQQ